MSGDGEITRQVRRYLTDCKRYRLVPSESGAVSVVYGPKQAVRDTYRHLTGTRPREEDSYGQ